MAFNFIQQSLRGAANFLDEALIPGKAKVSTVLPQAIKLGAEVTQRPADLARGALKPVAKHILQTPQRLQKKYGPSQLKLSTYKKYKVSPKLSAFSKKAQTTIPREELRQVQREETQKSTELASGFVGSSVGSTVSKAASNLLNKAATKLKVSPEQLVNEIKTGATPIAKSIGRQLSKVAPVQRVSPVVKITEPRMKVSVSGDINSAVRKLITSDPEEPVLDTLTNNEQRLFKNIGQLMRKGRIKVNDVPFLKRSGLTDDQTEEAAELLEQVSTFSGRTLQELSTTARALSKQFPEIKTTAPETLLSQAKRFVLNVQGAFLTSNFYTAAANAWVSLGTLPVKALDDALEAGIMAVAGKAPAKAPLGALANDFAALFRAFSPSGKRMFLDLSTKYPAQAARLQTRSYEPEAGKAFILGNKVADSLTIFNRFQDNLFAKIRADAVTRNKMLIRGVDDVKQLPAEDINDIINEAMKFTYRGIPDPGFAREVFKLTNNTPTRLLFNRFPRFFGLAMEFTINHSPAGFLRFFSPKMRQALVSDNPTMAARALAQASVGTILFGAGIAIRNSPMAGEKWYQIRVGNKNIDARRYFPLSSYLFIADLLKGAKNMTPTDFSQGIGLINRGGPGLFVLDAFAGRVPFNQELAKRYLGAFLGSFTVPLRQFQLAIGTVDPEETIFRSTKESPILGPVVANVPFLSRTLPASPRITRKEPLKTEQPLLRLLGVSIDTPNVLERELMRLGVDFGDLLPRTGDPKLDRLITQNTGPMVEKIFRNLEANQRYQQAPDDLKKDFLREAIGTVRKQGKMITFFKNAPDILQTIRAELNGLSGSERREKIKKLRNSGILTKDTIPLLLRGLQVSRRARKTVSSGVERARNIASKRFSIADSLRSAGGLT